MKTFAIKTALVLGLILLFGITTYMGYLGFNIILLIFSGLLAAVFLDSVASPLKKYTALPHQLCIGITVLVLFGVTALFFIYFVPALYEQFKDFTTIVPAALDSAQKKLEDISLIEKYMGKLPSAQSMLPENLSLLTGTQNILSLTTGALGGMVIIFFMGLYLALEPTLYQQGILKLIPETYHPRVKRFFSEAEQDLKGWLMGRLASMTVIGISVSIGLWLLNIPLAIFLGVLAGALSFIPYIGPLISAAPPLLFAFTLSVEKAVWVLLLFFLVQILESYILTPLIQKKVVSLPPALTLGFLTFFSACNGILGTALAAPVLVIILVAIRIFYLESLLEKEPSAGTEGSD